MRVVEINVVSDGSTGNIMLNISILLQKKSEEIETFSTYIFNPKYKKLPPAPEKHTYFGSYCGYFVLCGIPRG